ncbi:hypothetical protein HMI01_08050 [Halolactibacillus miurensis]|uniref:PilX N-terminal n=2 Tax=Halolactibacillus TaxID=306539 RepID=A0A1I6PIX0_9BACI|nr:PilX N-terminal domain-containing pilus assembly protein [Halolactibacillus miurensis]GEM03817.1 hypothetical protein HMI01_08050 [Halolactibacillus miurensis]SFS40127.1 PilX N-terminal [Halolactibacillus miurensis]
MKRLMKNESGVALVFTLMVLVVLSVLGATIGTVAMANVNLTENERDYQAAYYIAEAGVNETYLKIEEKILEIYENTQSESAFFDQLSSNLADFDDVVYDYSGTGDQKTASVEIINNRDNVTINSVGNVNEKKRNVSNNIEVNWSPKGGNFPPFPVDASLLVKNRASITGGATINGDVYMDQPSEQSFKINGGAQMSGISSSQGHIYVNNSISNDLLDLPNNYKGIVPKVHQSSVFDYSVYESLIDTIPEAPDYDTVLSNINLKGSDKKSVRIGGNIFINTVSLQSNTTLNLEIGSGVSNLIVNTLDLSNGHIIIQGNGVLNLYVKDSFEIGSSSTINSDGSVETMNLSYYGSSDFAISGGQKIKGSVYVKQASVKFTAGGGLHGGYLATNSNSVSFSGGTFSEMIMIAPKADVSVTGGAEINGVMLAKTYDGGGGTSIQFQNLSVITFPFGNTSDTDLIIKSPTSEIK